METQVKLCAGRLPYFALFAQDKRQLWAWQEAIVDRLARLRLTLHSGAAPKPVDEGLPFLGFVVYPQKRRLKRRKGIHYRQKLQRLAAAYNDNLLSFADLNASIGGWVNHVRFANTVGLRKAMFRTIHMAPQARSDHA